MTRGPRVTALALAAIGAGGVAAAQTVDVERASTIVVGTPSAGARTDRVDAARSGRVPGALPAVRNGRLRAEWRATLGLAVDVAPAVDAAGTTYVVGGRGEVVAIARDGAEKWRVTTTAVQPGAPALLADGTLVFADAAGEAVAVRDGALRWRRRFGRLDPSRTSPPAPLPLDDGGVVVSTSLELVAFDAGGDQRARATLPEPIASPLVAALGKVVAVTTSGAVWTWSPGAPEPTRAATFGAPVDDGVAAADARTLVAVSADHLHLLTVDLARGAHATRASSGAGIFLGPPAIRGDAAYIQLAAATGDLAVAYDASGAEVLRALTATHPAVVGPDGGPASLVASARTALLVDRDGALAFATSDGSVGVLSGGVVDTIAAVCAPPARPTSAPTVALAPLGPAAFVAACRSGVLTAIAGSASGEPAPPHL